MDHKKHTELLNEPKDTNDEFCDACSREGSHTRGDGEGAATASPTSTGRNNICVRFVIPWKSSGKSTKSNSVTGRVGHGDARPHCGLSKSELTFSPGCHSSRPGGSKTVTHE